MRFLDPVEPLDAEWTPSPRLDRRPLFLAEVMSPAVNGHSVRRRFGGVYSETARTVCGLRSWDDTREDVIDGEPWALFEVEKLVRMLLRQSGLAFELLASSRTAGGTFPAREIVRAAVTREIVAYYQDVARPLVEATPATDELWRWRSLLTGLLLTRTGDVSLHLDTLLDATGAPRGAAGEVPASDVVADAFAELDVRGAALPATPSDYAWLDEVVATLRMEAT